jgi:aspartyl-tRNA(Asn)/glutamyl-tRNA(Gln) amidotransferase subunit C
VKLNKTPKTPRQIGIEKATNCRQEYVVSFGPYYSRNCNNRGDFGQGANVLSLRPQRHSGDCFRCIYMMIKQDEIEKIAELARIRIAEDQIGELTQRITEILGMVDQLQAVDTRAVTPMANPLDATARLRADVITETNQRDAFQAIAPAVENGLYLVPKVID